MTMLVCDGCGKGEFVLFADGAAACVACKLHFHFHVTRNRLGEKELRRRRCTRSLCTYVGLLGGFR